MDWWAMNRRETLRVYHRLKRQGSKVAWSPSKRVLQASLKKAWRHQREPLELTNAKKRTKTTLYCVTASKVSKTLAEAIVSDLLDEENRCGNIWGVTLEEKRDHLNDELRRVPHARCYYVVFEDKKIKKIVAFAMYDPQPLGLFPFPVYVEDKGGYLLDEEEMTELLRDTFKQHGDALDEPTVYHELVFLCARPHHLRFGQKLFDAMLEHARCQCDKSITLLAGQAKHIGADRVVDDEKTSRVATNFYRKHWMGVRVAVKPDGKLVASPKGNVLHMQTEGPPMRLWAKGVRCHRSPRPTSS